ncbi:MAG: BamA/OMP85 family outer membrane protein [Planctomycetota bacterium]
MRYGAALVVVLAACATQEPEEVPPGPAIEFVGNLQMSASSLRTAARRELKAFAERQRPADAADAAYSMELELRRRGYPHGRVGFAAEKDRVVFTVEEGPRAYLGVVRFEGRESVPDERIRQFFDFEGAGALGSGRPLFRLSELEGAVGKVERFYLREGFYQVRVGRPRVTWNEDKTLADVTVSIEEGRWFHVKAVEFAGMDPVELDLVGRPYHARLPAAAAALLRSRLHAEGRVFSDVVGSAKVDLETAQVVIHLDVQRSPEVRVRKLEIEGNDRTRRWFLRRRIPLKENDVLRRTLLEEGVDNLYRTGLFSSVRSRVERADEDQADVTVTLAEIMARSLDFEIGYGSYELGRGAIRYRDRNLLGTGRRFRAEARGSVRSAGFELGIEDPYVLGERNVLEVWGGFLFREEPSFDFRSWRIDLQVRRAFRRHYRVSAGYRFRSEEASNIAVPSLDLGFINTAGLFASVRRDTTDSLLLPTRGSSARAGVFWSSPILGADLHFLELDLGYTKLVKLARRTVIGVGGRAKTRHILDGLPTLPIQERLFLGGATDVRSFYQSELGPSVGSEPLGGLTALNASIELRHGIYRALYGALFYDVGWLSPNSLSANVEPGHAIGAGLRYYLPVGPIRLDLAYNPGLLFAASERWAVHLAIGFSF